MTTTTQRIAALLLLPCLTADPVSAQAFAAWQTSTGPLATNTLPNAGRYTQEAIPPLAAWFSRLFWNNRARQWGSHLQHFLNGGFPQFARAGPQIPVGMMMSDESAKQPEPPKIKGVERHNATMESESAKGREAPSQLKAIPVAMMPAVDAFWEQLFDEVFDTASTLEPEKAPLLTCFWDQNKHLIKIVLHGTSKSKSQTVRVVFQFNDSRPSQPYSMEASLGGARVGSVLETAQLDDLLLDKTGKGKNSKVQALYDGIVQGPAVTPTSPINRIPLKLSQEELEKVKQREARIKAAREAARLLAEKKEKDALEVQNQPKSAAQKENGPPPNGGATERQIKPVEPPKSRPVTRTPAFMPMEVAVVDADDHLTIFPLGVAPGRIRYDTSSEAKISANRIRAALRGKPIPSRRVHLWVKLRGNLTSEQATAFQDQINEAVVAFSMPARDSQGTSWTDLTTLDYRPRFPEPPREGTVLVWLGPMTSQALIDVDAKTTLGRDDLQERLKVQRLFEPFLAKFAPQQLFDQLGAKDQAAFDQLQRTLVQIWDKHVLDLLGWQPEKPPDEIQLNDLREKVRTEWQRALDAVTVAKVEWEDAERRPVVPVAPKSDSISMRPVQEAFLNEYLWADNSFPSRREMRDNLVSIQADLGFSSKTTPVRAVLLAMKDKLNTHGPLARRDLIEIRDQLRIFLTRWVDPRKPHFTRYLIELDNVLNTNAMDTADGPRTVLGQGWIWRPGQAPQGKTAVIKAEHYYSEAVELIDRPKSAATVLSIVGLSSFLILSRLLPIFNLENVLSPQIWTTVRDPKTEQEIFIRPGFWRLSGLWFRYLFSKSLWTVLGRGFKSLLTGPPPKNSPSTPAALDSSA